jgi:protein deglycase
MKNKIAVHLANGFEEVEAISIIDVLRRADLDVVTVSVTGEKEVTGTHQIGVLADVLFEDVNYKDISMIILPGGMPGTSNLDAHEGLKFQIQTFTSEGKQLAAICAAPLILGKLGLLKGKKAVCYPGYEKYLYGAEIVSDPVVVAKNIITGKGLGVAVLFALKIVEKLVSLEKAEILAKQMIVE